MRYQWDHSYNAFGTEPVTTYEFNKCNSGLMVLFCMWHWQRMRNVWMRKTCCLFDRDLWESKELIINLEITFMLLKTSWCLSKPTEYRFICAYKHTATVFAVILFCLPISSPCHILDSSKEDPALALAAGDFHALKHHPVYFLSPLLWEANDKGNKLGEPEPDHAGTCSCPEQIIFTIWGDFSSLGLQEIGLPAGADMLTRGTQTAERGECATSTMISPLTFTPPRGSSKMYGLHKSCTHQNCTFTFERENHYSRCCCTLLSLHVSC